VLAKHFLSVSIRCWCFCR